jgi:aspartate/methionine/tyrosine aminotransferase
VRGGEGVLITAGSQEALYVCCLALTDPGDDLLFPDPGYPAYATLARLVGARPVPYRLPADRGFQLRAEDLEGQLTARARLVILNSPSNPTGGHASREELQQVLAMLARRRVAWVADEVYANLLYDGDPFSALELSPNGGLAVSSLSKDCAMTGWRLGWAAGDPSVIARLGAVHQHLVTCAPSVSQWAARRAFSTEGERARRGLRAILHRRRELMARELATLKRARYDLPAGAFYFFVDVSRYGDELELSRQILERQKVVTIPGRAFGPNGRGFLRLSFAAGEERIRRGIARIAAELEGRR